MNIGICSVFFDRGSGRIALDIKQAIQWYLPNCNISVLARMSVANDKKQIKFWDDYFHSNILLYPEYAINDTDFENWIISNKIDTVIFIEEQHTRNLVSICNKLGVKSLNYIVWEFFNPAEISYYKQFTYLVCPIKSCYNKLKNDLLLDNSVYIPWGVDLGFYQWQEPIKKDKPIIFFPAGFGGVNDRKNENAVISAFSYICPRDRAVLHIHTQKENQASRGHNVIKTSGTITEQELMKYYVESDIVVLPSRWEGNGLPFIEASAIGRPIITVDAPPMNERVLNNVNGLVCKVAEMKELFNIFVKSAEIDIEDFSNKMIELSEDKELLYNMQCVSREFAEANLNWWENSKKLIDIL